MGGRADAKSVSQAELATYDRPRHAGMDGGTHDRGSHFAREFGRSQDGIRFPQGSGVFRCGIQGPTAYTSAVEPAASTANPVGRWPHGGFGVTTGRISASAFRTRYAWGRSTRNQVQAALNVQWSSIDVALLPALWNCLLA